MFQIIRLPLPLALVVLLTACANMGMMREESGAMSEKGAGTAITCDNRSWTGHAADDYANVGACNADKPNLQTSAVNDGKTTCDSYCTAMSCTSEYIPANPTASAACAQKTPTFVVGTAVSSFTCRCNK